MLGYGALIKAAREAEEMSQTALAKRLGLNGHYDVSRIEDESKPITPDVFARLFHALPTLTPSEVVVAMGYPLDVEHRDSVPPELAAILHTLDQDQRGVLLRIARSLRGERRNRGRAQ